VVGAVSRRVATTASAGMPLRGSLLPSAVTYVLAWVIGLAVAPARPRTDAAVDLGSFLRGHLWPVLVQSLLVHGVAGVALAVVALATGRALASRASRIAGLLAAGLSLTQVALLVAATVAAGRHADDVVARFVHGVDGVDAVKLLALAAFAAVISAVGRRRQVLPVWAWGLGTALAGLLVLGSVSFVPGLGGTLGVALFAALPLLLVFIAALALLVARSPAAHMVEVAK